MVTDGIPCTTVARTVIDLADREPRRNVERLLDQAEILRVFDLRDLNAALERSRGRRGAAVIRSILAGYELGLGMTRNEVEERMLAICIDADLPRPEVNAWIPFPDGTGYEADFLWRKQKVIAEADGRPTHGTARAFEWDRARDRRLSLAEWRVLRFTRREILMSPESVAADLRAALL